MFSSCVECASGNGHVTTGEDNLMAFENADNRSANIDQTQFTNGQVTSDRLRASACEVQQPLQPAQPGQIAQPGQCSTWRPNPNSAEGQQWVQQAQSKLFQPLQLNQDGSYTARPLDSLDTIAARELHMAGQSRDQIRYIRRSAAHHSEQHGQISTVGLQSRTPPKWSNSAPRRSSATATSICSARSGPSAASSPISAYRGGTAAAASASLCRTGCPNVSTESCRCSGRRCC